MLKETETEETIGFMSTFFSLEAFQLGAGPPGYAYGGRETQSVDVFLLSLSNQFLVKNKTPEKLIRILF